MKSLISTSGRAALFLLICTVVCGALYTGIITLVTQVAFPSQTNGSIIQVDGKNYGSALLGQQYTDAGHLWGRLAVIDTKTFSDADGNALMYAGPTNLSPASDAYQQKVADRVAVLKAADPAEGDTPVPVDLVTASASGLDPDISPAAADYQVARIAEARGISESEVRAIIQRCTTGRFLGLIGEPTVNVLKVNLMLDGILE
jgi:K+-transporting ATPase ATPase C chain